MGISPFKKSCYTNATASAPNPDPSRFRVLEVKQFPNAYVLKVKYLDCTNYEGQKVLVMRGVFHGSPNRLDPHFSEQRDSPIARFRPDTAGWNDAVRYAASL